jgi:hypothetical protein
MNTAIKFIFFISQDIISTFFPRFLLIVVPFEIGYHLQAGRASGKKTNELNNSGVEEERRTKRKNLSRK